MNYREKLTDFFEIFEAVRYKCGRKAEDISVLFATKYLSEGELADFIRLFRQLKQEKMMIGENRVQDAQEKFSFIKKSHPDLIDYIYPVLIGNLQKNKINKALSLFREIHSIDSLELAEAINSRVSGAKMPAFLEINISGEKTKHGIDDNNASETIERVKIMPNIKLDGLMTMAPYTNDKNLIRQTFRKLRQLADRYKLKTSMGMSSDWQIAIEEGSDMIRIGSLIFLKSGKS